MLDSEKGVTSTSQKPTTKNGLGFLTLCWLKGIVIAVDWQEDGMAHRQKWARDIHNKKQLDKTELYW